VAKLELWPWYKLQFQIAPIRFYIRESEVESTAGRCHPFWNVPKRATLNYTWSTRYLSFISLHPLLISSGTGKTATVVELILQLHNTTSGKFLVCAPSNSAADLLAHNLSLRISPKEMLRLNAVQRNPKSVEPPSLIDYSFRSINGSSNFELPGLHILAAYRVIVCTCVSAGYVRGLGIEPVTSPSFPFLVLLISIHRGIFLTS
jgi:hypothetical protein